MTPINAASIAPTGKRHQGTTSQLAEKLVRMPICGSFVTGHEFTRAAKPIKLTWALAPAIRLSRFCWVPHLCDFSYRKKCQGTTSVVPQAHQNKGWALAPAGTLSSLGHDKRFSNAARHICFLLLLSLAAFPIYAQTPASGLYTIAGKVLNAVTGEPVRRAAVAVLGEEDSRAIASTESDNEGNFALPGLPAAKYQLTASKRGMRTAFYDEHGDFNSAIVTGPDQDTTHLIFRLTPGSVLHGVVTGDGGDPVAGANVLLFLKPHGHNPGERVTQVDSTSTDDTGSYEFGNLAAGEYLLAVKADPWYALHLPMSRVRSGGGTELDVAYPVTYYDSTTDEDSATPIVLSGGNREQADIGLHAGPALHLVVEVPRKDNETIAQPELRQSIFGVQVASASASLADPAKPGTTEFTGVAPGHYQLEQGYPPRIAELEATENQQVDSSLGVPLELVTGMLRTASGATLPAAVMVTLTRLDGTNPEEPINVNANNGGFNFSAPAGSQWEISATPSGGNPSGTLAVVSITIGNRTYAGDRLTVRDQPLSVVVTLSQASTRVEGFARDQGKGVSGAMIVLVPTNKSGLPGPRFPELARRDQSDSDGSFSLRDVAPGSYTVLAIADAWELDWARPEVIARYLSAGIPVTVNGNSGKSIQLSQPVPVQSR